MTTDTDTDTTTESADTAATAPAGGRPRDDAREQALLDAAAELLAEVGYDRLTVEAVATRAKASKATIYRRWAGKEQLVVAALRARVDHSVTPDTGSLRSDLVAVTGELCRTMSGDDGGLICGVAFTCRTDAGLAQLMRTHFHDDKRAFLQPILDRAVARGELAGPAPADLLVEVAPGMVLNRIITGGTADGAFAAHVVDDVLLPILTAAARPSAPPPASG